MQDLPPPYPGETHRSGTPKMLAHRWNTIMAFLKNHGVAPQP